VVGQARKPPREERAQRRLVRLHAFGKPNGLIGGWHGVSRGLDARRTVASPMTPRASSGIRAVGASPKLFLDQAKRKRGACVLGTGEIAGQEAARVFDLRGISVSGPCAPGRSGNRSTHGIRTEHPFCRPESRAASKRVCGSSPRAGTGTDQALVRAGTDFGRADHGRSLLVAQTPAG